MTTQKTCGMILNGGEPKYSEIKKKKILFQCSSDHHKNHMVFNGKTGGARSYHRTLKG